MESLTAAGQRIEYEFLGDGPLVVFVNIITMPVANQRMLAEPLVRRGYRVLLFQNHGPESRSGTAFADAVIALIDQLGQQPVGLWGFSSGSITVQEIALKRPDLVHRMVLLGTLGRTTLFLRMFFRAWREALAADEATAANTIAALFALGMYSPEVLVNDEAVAAVTSAPPSLEAESRAADASINNDLQHRLDELATISIPTLVVAFEHDLLIPAKLGEEVARAIPGARYELIRGASHSGPFTHADQIAELVRSFLAGT